MITILCGDHTEASRTALLEIKKRAKDKDVRVLDGKTLDTASLAQALESSSLFGGETVVIIENMFTKLGKKTKQIEPYTALLSKSSGSVEIVLWEEKEIGATLIRALGQKVQIKQFKLPMLLFQFLDELRANNAPRALFLYRNLTINEAPELVFAMIVRRVRELLMVSDGAPPAGLQGWQASRLTNQAKFFTMERLRAMHTALLTIEYSIKTGSSPFTLSQHIEQFIIEYM